MHNCATIHKPPPVWGTSSIRCKMILFSKASRTALGHTQHLIQSVPREFSPVVKWLGYEADHLCQSSAKVKNDWSYISTPPYAFQNMHRHNFTLYTVLIEVFHKIKICHQSRQLQKQSMESFSFGSQCNRWYFHRKICFEWALGEICNRRLIHYDRCCFVNVGSSYLMAVSAIMSLSSKPSYRILA